MTYPHYNYAHGKRDSIQVTPAKSVPLDPNNSDYAELMRQVAEEGLVIEEAAP